MQDVIQPGRELISSIIDDLHFKIKLESNIRDLEQAIKIREFGVQISNQNSQQSGNFPNVTATTKIYSPKDSISNMQPMLTDQESPHDDREERVPISIKFKINEIANDETA